MINKDKYKHKDKEINIEDFVNNLKRRGVWNIMVKFAKMHGSPRAQQICEQFTHKRSECYKVVNKYFH